MDQAVYYRFGQLEIIHLHNKRFTYSEHNHVSVYTIGFVLNGEITLKCSGHNSCYTAHSYFVIMPYQVHALLLPDNYDMLSICINKKVITTHKQYELFDVLSHMLLQLPVSVDYALLAEAITIMYEYEAPQTEAPIILSSALSLWRNPEINKDLRMTAEQANYSMYHYIKIFRQHIGMTPHKFQIQNKVRKAQRMIEKGAVSADVALDLGFYDQSHFIKCFKNIVGLTPGEYRKAAKTLT